MTALYIGLCAALLAWVSGCTTYTNPLTGTTRTFVELDKCIETCELGQMGVNGFVCGLFTDPQDRLMCMGSGDIGGGTCKVLCATYAKELPGER